MNRAIPIIIVNTIQLIIPMLLLSIQYLIPPKALNISAEPDSLVKKLLQNLTAQLHGTAFHIPSPSPVINNAETNDSNIPIPIETPLPYFMLRNK